MNYLIKYKRTLIGISLGTAAGYLYYYFIGCSSGHCAISSNPINSSVYGAIMGGLFTNLSDKEKTKTEEN